MGKPGEARLFDLRRHTVFKKLRSKIKYAFGYKFLNDPESVQCRIIDDFARLKGDDFKEMVEYVQALNNCYLGK